MSNYRRAKSEGATYFFTVVTRDRKPWFAKEANIKVLREAFQITMNERAFILEAAVILPDHLHCIWQLPENDSDFSGRWREIKKRTSRQLNTRINDRGERPVWQRRFWEHQIRNEHDWRNHMDYIHYNPVKHQLVDQVSDWPWSSFHQAVAKGWYAKNWGNIIPPNIREMNLE